MQDWMTSKTPTALFGFWFILGVLVTIRYLSLVDYFTDKRVNTSSLLTAYLSAAPFNLTHLNRHRLINIHYLPRSFPKNCRREPQKHIQLLVLVLSAPGNRKTRNAIRNLWASPDQSDGIRTGKAAVYFIVGDGQKAETAMREEMAERDDILIIDVKDNYTNIVYKVFSILHISANLCPSSFTLRMDEDVVFHIDRFLDGIHKYFFPEKADFYCRVWHQMQPQPSGKWYITPEQYSGDFYPDFCSGSAYVLTRKAARQILNHTHLLPDIQVENVLITGLIAQKASVNRVAYQEMFQRTPQFHHSCATLPDGTPALLAKHEFKTYGAMREAWKHLSAPHCP